MATSHIHIYIYLWQNEITDASFSLYKDWGDWRSDERAGIDPLVYPWICTVLHQSKIKHESYLKAAASAADLSKSKLLVHGRWRQMDVSNS